MRWMLVAVFCLMPVAAHATQVQEVVSDKGVKAWLVEDHALPLVAVKVLFRDSGAAYDAKGKGGRAMMTAEMLMEGAGALDSPAFTKALENRAIELGFAADDDGFTGAFNSLSEYSADAFSYMGMALKQARFDKDALERVRQQMLTALAEQEKEPGYLLHKQWDKQVFGDHPYANPVMGTKESVKALSAADLQGFVKAYLTRDHLVIAVVGDMTPAALKVQLDAQFAQLPAKAAPDVVVSEVALPAAAKQVVVDSDIPQTMAIFGTQGVKRDDPAFYDAYVMNYMLGGGGLNSVLYTELREKRGLTYSISTGLSPMEHAGVWTGGFATRNDKVGEAVAALKEALQRFAAQGPTDDELRRAKQYLTGSFVMNLDSNHDIANYLISMQVNHLGIDYFDKRNGLMNAVTKEGVKAIAAKMVDPKGLQLVMVGKPVLDTRKVAP